MSRRVSKSRKIHWAEEYTLLVEGAIPLLSRSRPWTSSQATSSLVAASLPDPTASGELWLGGGVPWDKIEKNCCSR